MLEQVSCKFFIISTVTSFYSKHANIIKSKPPNLIWNADETSAESSRKYKVLLR